MSEEVKPTLQAGEDIVEGCPICHSKFSNPVASNVKHQCPNELCQKTFAVMVFD
ncbi:hypothetical protein ES702_02806 [subsurface metagenome]